MMNRAGNPGAADHGEAWADKIAAVTPEQRAHEVRKAMPFAHTAGLLDDALVEKVYHYGMYLLDHPGMTVKERRDLFHIAFDAGDRKAAKEWLQTYLPENAVGLVEGL